MQSSPTDRRAAPSIGRGIFADAATAGGEQMVFRRDTWSIDEG
jgi:hypothetical protein